MNLNILIKEMKNTILMLAILFGSSISAQESLISWEVADPQLNRKFIEIWCLSVATFFSGYLAFYFIKMLLISYKFQERSEGADEILIWIPQSSVALGSSIFFICVFHQLILIFKKK